MKNNPRPARRNPYAPAAGPPTVKQLEEMFRVSSHWLENASRVVFTITSPEGLSPSLPLQAKTFQGQYSDVHVCGLRLMDDEGWSEHQVAQYKTLLNHRMANPPPDTEIWFQFVEDYVIFGLLKRGSALRLAYQKETNKRIDCNMSQVTTDNAFRTLCVNMMLPAVSPTTEGEMIPTTDDDVDFIVPREMLRHKNVIYEHPVSYKLFWNKQSLSCPVDATGAQRSLKDDLDDALLAMFTLSQTICSGALKVVCNHTKAGKNGNLWNSLKTKYLTAFVASTHGCIFGFEGTQKSTTSLLKAAGQVGEKQTEMSLTVLWVLKMGYKHFNPQAWDFPLGTNGNTSIAKLGSTVIKDRIYNGFTKPMEEHGIWAETMLSQKIGTGIDLTADVDCTKGVYLGFVLFLMKTNTTVREAVQSVVSKYNSGETHLLRLLTPEERRALTDVDGTQGTQAFANITPQKRAHGELLD